MRLIAPFVLLAVLASFEYLAFLGLRLALGCDARRGRARIVATLYWLATGAALAAVAAPLAFGARGEDGDPRVPAAAVSVAAAVYLPKIWLAVGMLLDLLGRGTPWLVRRALFLPAARRSGWLARTRLLPRVGLAVAGLTLLAVTWGATLGGSQVRTYRHTVLSQSLPAEFDGLRIAHLSDIHAASLGSPGTRLADRLVTAVNAEQPDLVVFSGDYGEPADFDAGPEILGRLRAPLGKFAVLGNHDFGGRERAADNWTSADDKRRKIDALGRAFRSRGFTLLTNQAAVLSRGSATLAVLGVGVYDPHHGFADADLAAAERAAGPAAFRLLLAHSPQYWESAVQGRRAIDLTLVGHTHGAQVGVGIGRLLWSPAALQYRHWGGLYSDGRQHLNVNRGVGYVGLPMRVNMPADLSLIVVRSAARH